METLRKNMARVHASAIKNHISKMTAPAEQKEQLLEAIRKQAQQIT